MLHICCVQNKLNVCLFDRWRGESMEVGRRKRGRETQARKFLRWKLFNACYFGSVSKIFRISKTCIARKLTLFFFFFCCRGNFVLFKTEDCLRNFIETFVTSRIFDKNLRYWPRCACKEIHFPNGFYKFLYYLLFLRYFHKIYLNK